MRTDSLIETAFSPESRYPFNDIISNPSSEFISYMNKKADSIKETAQRLYRQGDQSNNPRTRRNPHTIRRTGGYFATHVQAWVTANPRVRPEFIVSTEGRYGAAYEASHGHLLAALMEEANK